LSSLALRGGAIAVAVGAVCALAVSDAALPRLVLVLGPVGLIVAALAFASPTLALAALGAALPEVQDVTGGHLGLHIAASDVLLVLIGAQLIAHAVTSQRRAGILASLRPVRAAALQYSWMIIILLALHPGFGSAAKSFQRFELFGLPLIVGAYIALRREYLLVLRAYVCATTILAAVWPLLNAQGLTGQLDKNATGQFIASAILLLVAVRALRNLLPCLPILVAGLALTESRGAILGLMIGIAVLSVVLGDRSRRVLFTRTLVVLLTGIALYQLLPSDVTARLTSFSGAAGTSGAYNIDVRFQYARDAERIIESHPWIGIGVGNYQAGTPAGGTQTTDPHDVILLEAAEGGYIFAASFVLLIGGIALALWRLRWVELAPAAAAVLLAATVHGLVDVYWVRGTPVLGFLLVGMTCGLAASRPRGDPR
jgi:hypothetical protein